PEQPPPRRQHVAKAGLLRHHWSARSQVLRRTLAEPAAAQSHVLILRHRELAARLNDVLAITIHVQTELLGGPHAPAAALQHLPLSLVVAGEAEFESLPGSLGNAEHL